jgi:AmiR/NasT family two-component response regulator
MKTQKPLRVLIVDDQESIRELLEHQLAKMGYIIVGKAINGVQAVEMSISLDPEIVIMDIEMPEMNGLEATKEIMVKSPRPVVLLTSHEDPAMVRQASQVGAGAYLLKPPSTDEIERTMIIAAARFADLMELRRLNNELRDALEHVKVLSGLLPICASCKRIRNDEGYWKAVEVYITEKTDVQFSHSLCPACIDKLYPEYKKKTIP